MRKITLLLFTLFVSSFIHSQVRRFGISFGVDLASSKLIIPSGTTTVSETGYLIGTTFEFVASEKVHFQPEVAMVFFKNAKQLQIPLLTKYYVLEKLCFLGGPDVYIDLDKPTALTKMLGLGADIGTAFDFTDQLSLEAKYNLGITSLIKNAPSGSSLRYNGLFLTVVFKY